MNKSHTFIGLSNWRIPGAPFVGGIGGFAKVFVTASFACEYKLFSFGTPLGLSVLYRMHQTKLPSFCLMPDVFQMEEQSRSESLQVKRKTQLETCHVLSNLSSFGRSRSSSPARLVNESTYSLQHIIILHFEHSFDWFKWQVWMSKFHKLFFNSLAPSSLGLSQPV